MKHKAVRVDDLMYKGCEPHWKCTICGDCVPFHCYTREEFEQQECKGKSTKSKENKIKNNNCDCFIGMLNDYDNTGLITINELKEHIKETEDFVDMVKANGYNDLAHRKAYSLSDYCDKRKATDLTRFDYCPKCGEKIDWKGIKNE